MIKLSNDLLQKIQEEGAKQYPKESCGLVVKKGRKSFAVACKNTAEDPKMHFVMDVNDYAAAAEMGEIIGVWHTHVEISPQPSEADKVGCENSELPWYIVSVYKTGDEFSFSDLVTFEPTGYEISYVERPYAFGVLDCWTLVRDYYRREFDIVLGEYPRINRFWAVGYDFFGENWKKEGFEQITDGSEPKSGDLFLIQTDNFGKPNHIAVYVEGGLILHHAHGRLSRRDIYGGYWQKHTTHHLRHKTKC